MTTIKTTWGKVFENINIMMLNEYPNIVSKCGAYEELDQWDLYDDENDTYTEVAQWYIVKDYDVEWLKDYCPDIAEGIHYSETIRHYIMAVYHWGTPWSGVDTTMEVENENLAELYKKTFGVEE